MRSSPIRSRLGPSDTLHAHAGGHPSGGCNFSTNLAGRIRSCAYDRRWLIFMQFPVEACPKPNTPAADAGRSCQSSRRTGKTWPTLSGRHQWTECLEPAKIHGRKTFFMCVHCMKGVLMLQMNNGLLRTGNRQGLRNAVSTRLQASPRSAAARTSWPTRCAGNGPLLLQMVKASCGRNAREVEFQRVSLVFPKAQPQVRLG
jgi:hypothetical protein